MNFSTLLIEMDTVLEIGRFELILFQGSDIQVTVHRDIFL